MPPLLARGRKAEVAAVPERFPSRVASALGLPPLGPENLAEGLVAKPDVRMPAAAYMALKRKIAEMREDRFDESAAVGPGAPGRPRHADPLGGAARERPAPRPPRRRWGATTGPPSTRRRPSTCSWTSRRRSPARCAPSRPRTARRWSAPSGPPSRRSGSEPRGRALRSRASDTGRSLRRRALARERRQGFAIIARCCPTPPRVVRLVLLTARGELLGALPP